MVLVCLATKPTVVASQCVITLRVVVMYVYRIGVNMTTNHVSRIYQDLELFVDDDLAKLNSPIPSSTKYEPSKQWIEFLLRTRPILDKANEFLCFHNKFLWQACARCRRNSAYAEYQRKQLWPKVIEMLKQADMP